MQSWRKEGIVGDIWSEPRNSQSCRNFFGSHPISFLTLRHPLWKMPLAGSEMSQLISKIITLNISTPGSVGEREPSPCLQACTPPHICIQAHPYPSFLCHEWVFHCVKYFRLIYWNGYVIFLPWLVHVMDYINWFSNVEPASHTFSESLLVMVYNSFYILLD